MLSVYFAAPADWTNRTFVGGILLFCRDAVSVFGSPSRLDQQDIRWGNLSRLQRCSQCILQPQPTEPTGHSRGESYSSAEMQSVYFAAPADWTPESILSITSRIKEYDSVVPERMICKKEKLAILEKEHQRCLLNKKGWVDNLLCHFRCLYFNL